MNTSKVADCCCRLTDLPSMPGTAMVKRLYHGTRYLDAILTEGILRRAPMGDTHLSLTTKKSVARYWAKIVRDDVEGSGYILTLDGDRLQKDGYTLKPFQSEWAMIDEHEIACHEDIRPVLRYVLAIEKVPGTEMNFEDISKWWRDALARVRRCDTAHSRKGVSQKKAPTGQPSPRTGHRTTSRRRTTYSLRPGSTKSRLKLAG